MARLTAAGLFAGIGGIELGLGRAGFHTSLLCEIDPGGQSVLRDRFPAAQIEPDIRSLVHLPKVDVLSAGFPCQDLSQAGKTAGIRGAQSGLVDEVFRLVSDRKRAPKWLVLENVSFMLRLARGAAMDHVMSSLESMGFRWAYRILDSRAFGVPQRRQRVIILASRTEDPRPVLFGMDSGEPVRDPENASSFGFYWTEGTRGLGWAVDAIPTLKGGSTIGIASPPAVWKIADSAVITPDIRDAERLQGFPADWTACLGHDRRALGKRWKLVGNAVTTGVAEWLGHALTGRGNGPWTDLQRLERGSTWPNAAWGDASGRVAVDVSAFPLALPHPPLTSFLEHPGVPLSIRATNGFLSRARTGSLHFRPGFLEALDAHVDRMMGADEQLTAIA